MFEDVCACMLINCLNSTIPYYLNALLNSEEKRKNNSRLDILLSFLKTQEINVVNSKTKLLNCFESLNQTNSILRLLLLQIFQQRA